MRSLFYSSRLRDREDNVVDASPLYLHGERYMRDQDALVSFSIDLNTIRDVSIRLILYVIVFILLTSL